VSNHILVEVRWTNPDKEEEWVIGALQATRYPSGTLAVLWVPLDTDKEWTWACNWKHLHFEDIRLVRAENQLSGPSGTRLAAFFTPEDTPDDGQLELFPRWGTDQ